MLDRAIGRRVLPFALLPLLILIPQAPRAAPCDGVSPVTSASLSTVRVASGLLRPDFVASPPGDLERIFIVEQDGKIRILKNGILNAAPFLDISTLTESPADAGGNEEGLLGLAFHPDYANNGLFFVYHTDGTGANNLLVRYERNSANPDEADLTSRQVILTLDHVPFDNHNGGMIAFSPMDGYLYVATGDGGNNCDPNGNGQDVSQPLGKLLRIDVNSFPYAIPPNNPFVATLNARPEIWALGLRNPFRFSFDPANGDLYIGDVGQYVFEEVDYQPGTWTGGANYGWARYEGDHCPSPSCGSQGACDLSGYQAPILEYNQQSGPGCSIIGGVVYRGCRMPDLHGTYFYSDFCAAFLKTFRVVGGVRTDDRDRTVEMAPGGGMAVTQITSFGVDARGEIYILDRGGAGAGELYRVVPDFASLQVSGTGASQFQPDSPDWNWEDLRATSGYPVDAYRVYRSQTAAGPFTCVFRTASTSWPDGDPEVPTAGVLYSYLVVGELADGTQSSPGTGTGGAPRTLAATACPPFSALSQSLTPRSSPERDGRSSAP